MWTLLELCWGILISGCVGASPPSCTSSMCDHIIDHVTLTIISCYFPYFNLACTMCMHGCGKTLSQPIASSKVTNKPLPWTVMVHFLKAPTTILVLGCSQRLLNWGWNQCEYLRFSQWLQCGYVFLCTHALLRFFVLHFQTLYFQPVHGVVPARPKGWHCTSINT